MFDTDVKRKSFVGMLNTEWAFEEKQDKFQWIRAFFLMGVNNK